MLETFITVHSSDLIRECEEREQFSTLGSYTYLYVGRQPYNPVYGVKVIVAHDYDENVEHMPQFYDFTGWWVLANHDLIDADRVMFLQYDMFINDPNIELNVENTLDAGPGPIAFTAGHNLANNFMLILDGFQAAYDRGLVCLNTNQYGWPAFNEWPSTQGTAWRTIEFNTYMHWFRPLFDEWQHEVWAGHLAERTVKAWTATTGNTERYMIGAITHYARDCHGTGALMVGNAELHAQRAASFGQYTP